MLTAETAASARPAPIAPRAAGAPPPLLPARARLALALCVEIAAADGAPLQVKEIARRLRSDARSPEHVLQALVDAAILKHQRGARGGYRLARAAHDISPGEIVRAVLAPEGAGAALSPAAEIAAYVAAQAAAAAMAELDSISLANLRIPFADGGAA